MRDFIFGLTQSRFSGVLAGVVALCFYDGQWITGVIIGLVGTLIDILAGRTSK